MFLDSSPSPFPKKIDSCTSAKAPPGDPVVLLLRNRQFVASCELLLLLLSPFKMVHLFPSADKEKRKLKGCTKGAGGRRSPFLFSLRFSHTQ